MREVAEFVGTRKTASRRSCLMLACVIVLATGLRIGLSLRQPSEPIWRDGELYNKIAQHILAEGRYPVNEWRATPIQPVFLAVIYRCFGVNGTAARVATAVLGVLTCYTVYNLGRTLFSEAAGVLAAAILAVYPFYVYLNTLYEYPQTICILLLSVLATQFIVLSKTRVTWPHWVFTGLLLGVAGLHVPTVLTAAPLLAIWLMYVGRHSWHKRLFYVMVLAGSCSLVVCSWSAYVYVISGRLQLGSAAGGEIMYSGNCRLAWYIGKGDIADRYESEPPPPGQAEAYDEFRLVKQSARRCPVGRERDAVYREAVKRWFLEHPREATLLLLRKAYLYWCPYAVPSTRHQDDNCFTRAVQTVSFACLLILALVGVFLQRRNTSVLVPIYIIVLSQWVTYSLFIVAARYRSHVDVFLVVLAAPVVAAIGEVIRKRCPSLFPCLTQNE